jgi:hypothetical protein
MRYIIAGLLTILISTEAESRTDFLGNILPEVCYDVSDVDVPIKEIPADRLRDIIATRAARRRREGKGVVYGAWLPDNTIVILKGMPEPLRSYVIKHEQCHAKLFELYGFPHWHP